MAGCNNVQGDKTTLMERMDDKLKEFLEQERIDSSDLIGFLTMRGVATMEDFYREDPSNMRRFLTPTQFDKLKALFEDNGIVKATSKVLEESKNKQKEGVHEEAISNSNYDYEIEKNAEGYVGNAIIIVNKEFQNLKDRNGAEKDKYNLEAMFDNLNVKTESYLNLDGNAMQQRLEKFGTKEFDVSIVFVAISTHGDENNTVLSTDNVQIHLDILIELFQSNKSLIGKPKVFFIQSCRGELFDEKIPLRLQVSDYSGDEERPSEKKSELNPHQTFATNTSDVLIAYATGDNRKAFRDEIHGSWFITELKNVVEKHPERHLTEIITITTNVIIQEHIAKINGQFATQCCNYHSSLTKFVKFL